MPLLRHLPSDSHTHHNWCKGKQCSWFPSPWQWPTMCDSMKPTTRQLLAHYNSDRQVLRYESHTCKATCMHQLSCSDQSHNRSMPIHSIQMLIAFVKTTDTSPLQIPSIISKIPKTASAGPIHLDSVIFWIIFSLSVMIIFYFETFLSSFSTISFHSSSVWLPV